MNKDGGFIKVYRSMLQWEWHDEPVTVATWYYCLLRANYTENKWHGKTVKSGQFITSLDHMAKDIGVTVSQLRTALKHLKMTNNITSESTNASTLVTVENYGLYQSGGEKIANEIANRMTNESQTNNKRMTNESQQIKKEKKEKKEKNLFKENKEKVDGSGAFATAWYNPPDPLSEEETTELMSSAHEQFAPIKAALMKEAT